VNRELLESRDFSRHKPTIRKALYIGNNSFDVNRKYFVSEVLQGKIIRIKTRRSN
jgi:hypothetical protein